MKTENNITLTLHILQGVNGSHFLKGIDSRITDNQDWGPRSPSVGTITIPGEYAQEIIKKLEQSSQVFCINGVQTEAYKKCFDPESSATENNIKIELCILADLNRQFLKKIDSRITDNNDWDPRCPSSGSISIPASCANEIIKKLQKSPNVFSINNTDTEAGIRFWAPNSLLSQYSLTKYALAGAGLAVTAAAIGTGIYLKKNHYF